MLPFASTHALTTTQGVVALAAGGVAVAALLLALVLALRLRRLRAATRMVLGEHGDRDLVAHATRLESEFGLLSNAMEDVANRLHERMERAERRLDGAIAHRGLVRYDAYNEMSGRQSTTIALLDDSASGLVLSSIHHRDQARLYAKRVRGGEGDLDLSPEESEAVRQALDGDGGSPAAGTGA